MDTNEFSAGLNVDMVDSDNRELLNVTAENFCKF